MDIAHSEDPRRTRLGDACPDRLGCVAQRLTSAIFAGMTCRAAPRAVEPLPVHEESRGATDCGPPASGDIGEDALPKAVLAERRSASSSSSSSRPAAESRSSCENRSRPVSNKECASQNFPSDRGELGKLRSEVRSGMQLGIGEVSPDKARVSKRSKRDFSGRLAAKQNGHPKSPYSIRVSWGASEPVRWSRSATAASVLALTSGTRPTLLVPCRSLGQCLQQGKATSSHQR